MIACLENPVYSPQNTNSMTKEAGFNFRQWNEIFLSSRSIQMFDETQPTSNPVDFRTSPPPPEVKL